MSALPFKTLDNSTVPAMLALLDSKFYPTPSPGLTARMGILWALTGAYILLSLNYLYLHVKHSKETPKWRSLWLARFVERPSGRFLVLNPRPTWIAVVISYGFYELFATGMFWRVYYLGRHQDGWAGVRSYNGLALFIGGWCISWSGLQAFLLTTESNDSHLLPAWLANGLLIGGGACLILLHIALAAYTTVLTEQLLNRYYALHEALAALNRRLAGATPTIIDLLPIQTLFQPVDRAAKRLLTPNCVQYALIATLPLACLMVNIGGLALARKLRSQIKDSVSLLALQDTQHQGTQAAVSQNVLAEDFAFSDPVRRPSDFDTHSGFHRMVSIPLTSVITRTMDENKRKLSVGVASDDSSKRKPSLTTNDVKLMARHGNTKGGTAARSQARKVLALQKATRDLFAVTVCIMFITLSLFGYCIWVAWLAGTDRLYEGSWSVTEGSAMICQWIYSVFVCFGVGFLNYNAWMNGREWLADDLPNGTTNGVGATTFGAGGAGETRPAMAATTEQRVSYISHFIEAGSAERPAPPPVDYPPLSPRTPSPSAFGPTSKDQSPTTSASSAPSSTTRRHVVGERKPSATRFSLPRPHWPFLRQNSSDSISNGRRRGVGAAHGAGGSATASAIMVTVETDQVCDGDTCALWYNDQDKAERGESGR
ncbi:hypothetical protein NBRC10512_006993 [Rhodotorula toruloides]|uniref:RHTO0S14e04346g1_1 n=2 Tax=Rhodotorula toruloides TaxID=5286 RepID=A0A061BC31_RHOTO|nr:uncharacterized protein RHTO_05078 [Rhodotorula toruloides NP11]EMS24898.1 hypothetical protein RHTO_05078 [Rhodotorula toruloides NP11]CDR47502.1 RHTO0S14e04346g1_1 [Rhodotorula toruloides]